MTPALLAAIRCPKSKSPLRTDGESLVCDACRLRYRVDAGVPVLLVEEAVSLDLRA